MIARIELQSPHLLWLAMLGLTAVFTAVVWLYRPQVRPVPRPWWWLLLGLRMLALAVLTLSILRPAIRRPAGQHQRGVVAILIDQSRSMSVLETGSKPADWVQVAAALGTLPAGARSTAMSDLREQAAEMRQQVDEIARAKSELEYARLAARGISQAEVRLRDARDALVNSTKALAAAPAGKALEASIVSINADSTSEQVAQRIEQINALETAEDDRLYHTNQAVRTACDELAQQPRIELVRRALAGPSGLISRISADRPVRIFGCGQSLSAMSEVPESLSAEAPRSNLSGALRDLRRQLGAQPLAAVVLFSDGRQIIGDATPSMAWTDAPIIAVTTAARALNDISITAVTAPASVFVGQSFDVTADIRASGFDKGSVEVTVEAAGQRQTRLIPINSEIGRVSMPLTLDRAGPVEITISAAAQPDEATDGNNQVRRVVKVISEKIRVALLGGSATQDYQHLRNALPRVPGFAVVQNRVPADQILNQDVVILSEVPTSALDAGQWDAVNQLVSQRGGSVIVVLGDPAIASGYAASAMTASLLPWRGDAKPVWRASPTDNPSFRIAAASNFPERLKSADDLLRWNDFPPISRFLAMPPLKSGVQPLLVERESGLPVLTEMKLGAGRVIVLALNQTWRWGQAMGRPEQERFWLGLVRYAGRESYVLSDGLRSLDADRLRPEPGEPLRARAKLSGKLVSSEGQIAESPTLQLLRGDEVLRSEVLRTPSRAEERYEALFPDLPAGDYELRLTAAERSLSLPIHVALDSEAEMRDVSGDVAELVRLAGSRGDVLSWSELPSLPQRIARLGHADPQFIELRLWDSPYLFLFVLGCLGVEWAVRRRFGLP